MKGEAMKPRTIYREDRATAVDTRLTQIRALAIAGAAATDTPLNVDALTGICGVFELIGELADEVEMRLDEAKANGAA